LESEGDSSRNDDLASLRGWYAGSPVDVRYTSERGRFLVASRDISEGETVVISSPYAFSVTEPEKRRVCSHCLKVCAETEASLSFPCPDCEEVWYCSSVCRELDAPQHRFECSLLKAFIRDADWAVTENRTEIRLILKILSRRGLEQSLNERDSTQGSVWKDHSFADFLRLDSHRKRLDAETLQMFEEVAVYLQQMDAWLAGEEVNLLVGIFLRARINGCSLWTTRTEIGQGIYLEASLLNHSCQPTLCHFRPERSPSLHFIAIEDVPRGEELSVCYYDAGSLISRRDYLQHTYFFECHCRRCVEEEQGSAEGYLAWRERVGCPVTGCAGILLSGTPGARGRKICSICGFSLNSF
jgi:predicted RNA-binding Zn-ribbon protein involved in translation (DUF1610 family)